MYTLQHLVSAGFSKLSNLQNWDSEVTCLFRPLDKLVSAISAGNITLKGSRECFH
jgi:hypothetical protein